MVFHSSTIFLACVLSGVLHNISIQAEPLEGVSINRVGKGFYRSVASIAHKRDKYFEEATHICTGVFIKKKFVLTAAHCVHGKSPADIRIIAGSVDLREGRKYDVDSWVTYKQWTETHNITKYDGTSNDIAIIKCACIITFWLPTAAIVSFSNGNFLIDEDVTLVGWGFTKASPLTPSRYLNEGRARVLSNEECEVTAFVYFNKKVIVPEQLFCSKGISSMSVAHGDSGGPVFSGNFVVGINMGFCPETDSCNVPIDIVNKHKLNIHILLGPYEDFISDVMNNY